MCVDIQKQLQDRVSISLASAQLNVVQLKCVHSSAHIDTSLRICPRITIKEVSKQDSSAGSFFFGVHAGKKPRSHSRHSSFFPAISPKKVNIQHMCVQTKCVAIPAVARLYGKPPRMFRNYNNYIVVEKTIENKLYMKEEPSEKHRKMSTISSCLYGGIKAFI